MISLTTAIRCDPLRRALCASQTSAAQNEFVLTLLGQMQKDPRKPLCCSSRYLFYCRVNVLPKKKGSAQGHAVQNAKALQEMMVRTTGEVEGHCFKLMG